MCSGNLFILFVANGMAYGVLDCCACVCVCATLASYLVIVSVEHTINSDHICYSNRVLRSEIPQEKRQKSDLNKKPSPMEWPNKIIKHCRQMQTNIYIRIAKWYGQRIQTGWITNIFGYAQSSAIASSYALAPTRISFGWLYADVIEANFLFELFNYVKLNYLCWL